MNGLKEWVRSQKIKNIGDVLIFLLVLVALTIIFVMTVVSWIWQHKFVAFITALIVCGVIVWFTGLLR